MRCPVAHEGGLLPYTSSRHAIATLRGLYLFQSVGARLTPFRKTGQAHTTQDELGNDIQVPDPTNDGTRPIEAREHLRKLVGKLLMRHPAIREMGPILEDLLLDTGK